MKEKDLMSTGCFIFTALCVLIVGLFVSSMSYCAWVNGRVNDKFESIKMGTAESEIVFVLGAPKYDEPPYNSLSSFWGGDLLPENERKEIKKTLTYKAIGPFSFFGARTPAWQIGLDEHDKAVCKHFY